MNSILANIKNQTQILRFDFSGISSEADFRPNTRDIIQKLNKKA